MNGDTDVRHASRDAFLLEGDLVAAGKVEQRRHEGEMGGCAIDDRRGRRGHPGWRRSQQHGAVVHGGCGLAAALPGETSRADDDHEPCNRRDELADWHAGRSPRATAASLTAHRVAFSADLSE